MREIGLYFQSINRGDVVAAMSRLAGIRDRSSRETLEGQVMARYQAPAAVALGSGRSAIFLWLQAVGVGPGDEVLVTGFTCLAVIVAVQASGATPVYVDIDPLTLNAPAANVEARTTRRTRAVIVQHTLGNPAVVEPIVARARARGIATLEDCALAVGSRSRGGLVGSFADAAIFSCELSKTLSSGWGGLLLVNDPVVARRVRTLADAVPEPRPTTTMRRTLQAAVSALCYHPSCYAAGKYGVAALFKVGLFRPSTEAAEYDGTVGAGFLQRMADPQAVMVSRQWTRLDRTETSMGEIRTALSLALVDAGTVALPVCDRRDTLVSNRVSLLVPDPPHAVEWFRRRRVEIGRWFDAPISPMPGVPARIGYTPGDCPVAEAVSRHIINLPAHPRMQASDARRVARLAREYLAQPGHGAISPHALS